MNRNRWLSRVALSAALLLAIPCYALDLSGLFGSGGDSGSGKVAHLEFRLKDGFGATTIVWSPDGKYIVTAGVQTKLIHVWDVEQRKLVKELTLPNPPSSQFHNAAWSPDGRYFAICDGFQTQLLIYGTSDWNVAKQFGPDLVGACQKPVFSSDGSELSVWAHNLVTFSVGDWGVLRMLKGPSTYQDGQFVRRRDDGWDSTIRVRDMNYVPRTQILVFGGGQYERGGAGACGSTPPVYTSRIWTLEPTDKALTQSFLIHCAPNGGSDVTLLTNDPTGSRIVASVSEGSNNNIVRVIDRTTGQLLGVPLQGHRKGVPQSIVYTPDGRFLLIGESSDFTEPSPVYIVDAKSLQILDVVRAPASIQDMAVDPRGKRFAVSSFDGFTIWKLISQ